MGRLTQPFDGNHVGEVVAGRTIAQHFSTLAPLERIALKCATFDRQNHSTVEITLRQTDGDWTAPAIKISASSLRDNDWFDLPDLGAPKTARAFRLQVTSPDATPQTAITLRSSHKKLFPFGALEIDGVEQQCDLTIMIDCAGGPNYGEERDFIRYWFAKDMLCGTGIELGAGEQPHIMPVGASSHLYDIRSTEGVRKIFNQGNGSGEFIANSRHVSQIKVDFPRGVDFLIAHNVLEHCTDPIKQLIEWNSLVKPGGVVVLSLPHYLACDDRNRPLTPVDHLIEDYLVGETSEGYRSKEHMLSFIVGWAESFARQRGITSISAYSNEALALIRQTELDAHWHTFDHASTASFVAVTSALGGHEITMLGQQSPESESSPTVGDILIAYRVEGRGKPSSQARTVMLSRNAYAASVNQLVTESGKTKKRSKVGKFLQRLRG